MRCIRYCTLWEVYVLLCLHLQLRIIELYLVLLISFLELVGERFYKEPDSVPEVSTDHRIQCTVFMMVVGPLVRFIRLNVQANNEKCCICKRRSNRYSNQKTFLSLTSYEQDFVEALSVDPHAPDRHGLILQGLVAALRKWRKNNLH